MYKPDRTSLVGPMAPRRYGTWAWPFLLALLFVGAVGAWLQWSDTRELEDERRTLITDALTLETRIAEWIAGEQAAMAKLADELPPVIDDTVLLRQGIVAEGLRRQWISVTALDAGNRLLAHVPQQTPRVDTVPASRGGLDDGGLTAHLSSPLRKVPGGGLIVVRFAPASLLRQIVPWWLARKYDIRLLDGFDQVIASTGDVLAAQAGHAKGSQSHRINIDSAMIDVYLELTTRDVRATWWRTWPIALMAVFLLSSAAATWMLRRQMREVARAEAAWRNEAAWRRAIEDSLTVGLRGRDNEGRLTHVNRAFCDLVGLTPDELVGRMPPMPYWPPDAIDDVMERHRRNMSGGAPREGYESRWIKNDGTPIDVMVFEAPLIDATGTQVGWMGSIIDIGARKKAEERDRHQLEVLARHARLTMLGEVASALAHELNQPLTAIAGYNAGALRSLEQSGVSNVTVLDALRRLGEQASEAGRIVQRIREFLTRRVPQFERCDLAALGARMSTLLRRDFQRSDVDVEIQLGKDLPPVWVDPVLIEQVLINLVRNAADEFKTHQVGAPKVCVSASRAGERFMRIDVDDNGPGLGGRTIEQLSAPFYSTKPDGMGMGLAICRTVIEAHYGGIESASSPLGGARISFTLPLADTREGGR
jgi:two-component system sensor histidine kinase DctS